MVLCVSVSVPVPVSFSMFASNLRVMIISMRFQNRLKGTNRAKKKRKENDNLQNLIEFDAHWLLSRCMIFKRVKKKTEPFAAKCVKCVPCQTHACLYTRICSCVCLFVCVPVFFLSHVFHRFYFEQLSKCVRKSVPQFEPFPPKGAASTAKDETKKMQNRMDARANEDVNCVKFSQYAEQMQIANDAIVNIASALAGEHKRIHVQVSSHIYVFLLSENSSRKLFSISLSCQCEHEQCITQRERAIGKKV